MTAASHPRQCLVFLPNNRAWVGVTTFSDASKGQVVNIMGDGNCCYHLGGTILGLLRDPEFVSGDCAPCAASDTALARKQIEEEFLGVEIQSSGRPASRTAS